MLPWIVDWKGNLKGKKPLQPPTLKEFEVFFENLYKFDNQTEQYEILKIESHIDIPIIDDPSTENEAKKAFREMKKPGFDYNLPILSILVTNFSFMLVNLLNMIFLCVLSCIFSMFTFVINSKKREP